MKVSIEPRYVVHRVIHIAIYLITETSSNIVFERHSSSTVSSEGHAPVEVRKKWGEGEGIPLVAMLQEKTLQTGNYAVNSTQSTCLAVSKG